MNDAVIAASLGRRSLDGNADERQRLQNLWGADTLAELSALNRESDPSLYFEALHGLARRLRDQDRLEAAQSILAFVAESAPLSGQARAQQAQADLDAILGRGNFGARFEFLSRRFAREAASPSLLLGMTAASAVFQVTRLGVLARLTASPTANFLTRGLGARTLASVGAFALEAPSFALASRGVRSILEPNAPQVSLGHEILGSYLTLGGLKLFGALGEGAVRRSGSRGLTRILLPQVSTYFGIVAGHRLEQWAGLRPSLSNDTLWSDSLLTLLQFHVGGRLAQELAGPGLQRWQADLELRSRETGALASRPDSGSGWVLEPSLAVATAGAELDGAAPAFLPMVMMMKGKGREVGANGSQPRLEGARIPEPAGEPADAAPGEKTSYDILQDLVGLREQARSRGETLSLWQVLDREIKGGRIPESRRNELTRAAYSRTLYENSPLLRKRVSDRVLGDIPLTVTRLDRLREGIAKEQDLETYSLATLVQALAFGGRIPFAKMRQYLSAAASLDFYRQHPSLESVPANLFEDPYLLAAHLRPIRRRIEESTGRRYKLATLVDGLQWHPNFPRSQLQRLKMVASAGDYMGGLSFGRLRLRRADLEALTFDQVLLRLLHLRPVLRGEEGKGIGIGYALMGLRSHGIRWLKDGELNESALTQAHVLDWVYERWSQWGGHFRNLSELPHRGDGAGSRLGWTRPTYARRFLTKDNGEPYSTSYLGGVVRWGEFLWQHREALHLPEPDRVEVPPLDDTRRSRLFAFLGSHWDNLKSLVQSPESLFQRLLELREEFNRNGGSEGETALSQEPGDQPSLRIMVASVFRAKNKPIPRTLEVYGAAVDTILQRWSEWRRHFRRISELPRYGRGGESRIEYATAHFRQDNGEPYSATILSGMIRWGTWIWNNRSSLGLRDGNSTQPPPSDVAAEEE